MKNNFLHKSKLILLAVISTQTIFCTSNDPVDYIPNVVVHITEASQSALHQALRDFASNIHVNIHLDSQTHQQLMQLSKLIAALGLIFVGVLMTNHGIKKIHKKERRASSISHIVTGSLLSLGSLIYLVKHSHN